MTKSYCFGGPDPYFLQASIGARRAVLLQPRHRQNRKRFFEKPATISN